MTKQEKSKGFKDYQAIHNFMYPDEPLKSWVTAESYTNTYKQDWNVIMPVVEKCTQIGFRDQEYDSPTYEKWESIFDDASMFLGSYINEVYDAVVQFIHWHNENK